MGNWVRGSSAQPSAVFIVPKLPRLTQLLILALAALLAWPWSAALAELRALTQERPATVSRSTAHPGAGPARADRGTRREEGPGPAPGLDVADDPDQDEADPGVPAAAWVRVDPAAWSDRGGPPPAIAAAPRGRAAFPSVAHWFRC